jgi:hypothetical protein
MRMACDSSYLLDGTSDYGTKADELMAVLEELFERAGVKAVIFSQWVRMHELLARRLKARGWGHVLFHGGIATLKRGELISRFREDPRCRVFLSTDAGGVGLNLQHASVVVNVDLPWNPAVLEQRIGRVHRLGQTQPVLVINFVSKGTIEEGMIGLLGFKRSVFAGVLDGGERDVFLGGSRLKQFMESVDKVTASIPVGASDGGIAGPPSAGGTKGDRTDADGSVRRTGAVDGGALTTLLEAGIRLFEQFAAAAPSSGRSRASRDDGPHIVPFETIRDELTGQRYLKVRMPSPDVVERVAHSLRALLESLQR